MCIIYIFQVFKVLFFSFGTWLKKRPQIRHCGTFQRATPIFWEGTLGVVLGAVASGYVFLTFSILVRQHRHMPIEVFLCRFGVFLGQENHSVYLLGPTVQSGWISRRNRNQAWDSAVVPGKVYDFSEGPYSQSQVKDAPRMKADET